MLVQVRDPCFPASARYLRPVSVRLILGELPLPPLHVPAPAASFLVASICLYPSRTAGVSRYLPPNLIIVAFNSVLPFEFINTHCNVFLYVQELPRRALAIEQPT